MTRPSLRVKTVRAESHVGMWTREQSHWAVRNKPDRHRWLAVLHLPELADLGSDAADDCPYPGRPDRCTRRALGPPLGADDVHSVARFTDLQSRAAVLDEPVVYLWWPQGAPEDCLPK